MNLNFTIILQAVTFLILVGILVKLIYRPLLVFLDKRKESVKNALDQAKKRNEEAEQNNALARKILEEVRGEAINIKNKTREEVDKARLALIEGAKKEAARLLERAKKEIGEDARIAKETVKKEISSIALEIAEKMLEREIKESDHRKLIKKSLEDMGRG